MVNRQAYQSYLSGLRDVVLIYNTLQVNNICWQDYLLSSCGICEYILGVAYYL